MKPGGDRVRLAAELAPGMEGRHNRLDRRNAGSLVGVYRDTTPIVFDGNDTFPVDSNDDFGTVTAHEFVDCVVDRLVDELMQAALIGAANVHTRPEADGFHAFEDLDVFGGVAIGLHFHLFRCHNPS